MTCPTADAFMPNARHFVSVTQNSAASARVTGRPSRSDPRQRSNDRPRRAEGTLDAARQIAHMASSNRNWRSRRA